MNNEHIEEILKLQSGDTFNGIVKITKRFQPGPIILEITDGTGFIDAVSKDYFNFKENDVVKIQGYVTERNNKLQIEISNIFESTMNFNKIVEEKSNPKERELSINSDNLKKLSPYFTSIAKKIRFAILNRQPIMIRHHNDADGVTSAIALENAISSIMEKLKINPQYNLYRYSSRTPYYDMIDTIKDLSTIKRIEAKEAIKPLILIVDTGSSIESLFSFKIMESNNIKIIVIDHHNPGEIKNKKTIVCPYLYDHINPYMEELNGNITAGMLCYEIARLVNEDYAQPILPAISGLADKSDCSELEMYIKNSGKSKEMLLKIGNAMTYFDSQAKFDLDKKLFEELIENKKMVDVINEELNKNVEIQIKSAYPNIIKKDFGNILYATINIEEFTLRSLYPSSGKIMKALKEKLAIDYPDKKIMFLGIFNDMITLRADHDIIDLQKIIEKLSIKIPEANIMGGGHEVAGSIKFVSGYHEQIMKEVEEIIKNVN